MEDLRRKSIKFQGPRSDEDDSRIAAPKEKQTLRTLEAHIKTKGNEILEQKNYQEFDKVTSHNLRGKLNLIPVGKEHLTKKITNLNSEKTDTYVFDEKIQYRSPKKNSTKNASGNNQKRAPSREKFESKLKEKLLVCNDFPVLSPPNASSSNNKPKQKGSNSKQENPKTQAKSYSQIFPARLQKKATEEVETHLKIRSEEQNTEFFKWISDIKNSAHLDQTLDMERNEYQINYGPETVNFAELKRRGLMNNLRVPSDISGKIDEKSLFPPSTRGNNLQDFTKQVNDKNIVNSGQPSDMKNSVRAKNQLAQTVLANASQCNDKKSDGRKNLVEDSGIKMENQTLAPVSPERKTKTVKKLDSNINNTEDIGLGGEIVVYTALVDEDSAKGEENEGEQADQGASENTEEQDDKEQAVELEQKLEENEGEQKAKVELSNLDTKAIDAESKIPIISSEQDCQDEPCNEPSWFKEYGIDRANRLLNIKLDHTSEDELRMESIETQIDQAVMKPAIEVEKKEEIKKKTEKKKKPKMVCEELDVVDSLYNAKPWVIYEEPSWEKSTILLEEYGEKPCYARGQEPCEEPCVQPPTKEASDYLKLMLSNYLVPALTAVALYRPRDPIEYLAYWLLKERQKGKFLEERKKLAEEITEMRHNIEAEKMEEAQMKLLRDRALEEFNPENLICGSKPKKKGEMPEEMEIMGEEGDDFQNEEENSVFAVPEHDN